MSDSTATATESTSGVPAQGGEASDEGQQGTEASLTIRDNRTGRSYDVRSRTAPSRPLTSARSRLTTTSRAWRSTTPAS